MTILTNIFNTGIPHSEYKEDIVQLLCEKGQTITKADNFSSFMVLVGLVATVFSAVFSGAFSVPGAVGFCISVAIKSQIAPCTKFLQKTFDTAKENLTLISVNKQAVATLPESSSIKVGIEILTNSHPRSFVTQEESCFLDAQELNKAYEKLNGLQHWIMGLEKPYQLRVLREKGHILGSGSQPSSSEVQDLSQDELREKRVAHFQK